VHLPEVSGKTSLAFHQPPHPVCGMSESALS